MTRLETPVPDAEGFCTKCTVVAEGEGFIVREAVILNDELTEIVTFAPQRKVSFHQIKSPREGVIINEILEDEAGALLLRFYAYLGLLGVAPGSTSPSSANASRCQRRAFRRIDSTPARIGSG